MLLPLAASADDFELSGKIGFEQRYFAEQGQYDGQLEHSQASIFVEPELYWGWNEGSDTLTFKPFYRQDEYDDERSHADIRELSYIHASDNWELRAGIRKEFWGVTEFQHLVDVINQTDGVEDTDGEDKLGQLMLNLSLVKDWGIIDMYLLPGFRERTFVGQESRLRGPVTVDNHNIRYESSAEDNHLDVAMRWSHTIGAFDLGSYWFHGTNREPILTPVTEGNKVVLNQYYNQMDQFGVDLQATINDWLWKFETIYRTTDDDDFWATQAGFEYTFIGVFDSNADVGLLTEYGWDSRGEGDENSPGANIQDDIFLGSRLAFNDMQSSEMLIGFGADLEHNAFSFLIEGNRRFGENVKISLDLRLLQSTNSTDQLYVIKDDDHIQLAAEYYF
ncbi:hypothetical protein RI844_04360 [Thalassotalea fonticola]|uniref:Uncharacterized protein n=1 Tax=Thalassotalea fonticola TaxID=3065649 RepID=A0ABZ0GR97_9GAMM|nr:hypothetical protein RI844_04360 [Colwelliaceae bacterium S1-1]